jgi:hypothetical protein
MQYSCLWRNEGDGCHVENRMMKVVRQYTPFFHTEIGESFRHLAAEVISLIEP